MNNIKPKLIIWDFDGVIADSEKLWIKNRQIILNEQFGLNWDFETTNKYLGGMSDKTKIKVLNKMDIPVGKEFIAKALELDYAIMKKEMKAMPDVEKIFSEVKIKQCVATGGIYDKTLKKIEAINFEKYITKANLFTADMVDKGKPEPDLFLLAAKIMGESPQNCLVIEDSIAGMTAGLSAGMQVIAFLGSDIYKNDAYRIQVKKMGIKNIFYDMKSLKTYLEDII